jgi:hypothetical protein
MDQPDLRGAIPQISIAWLLNLSKTWLIDDHVKSRAVAGVCFTAFASRLKPTRLIKL